MWWYTLGVLALWVTDPEIRRFYDLYFGLSQVEVLAILPLLSLTPHIWSLTFGGGWKRLPQLLMFAAWIWIGGFAYALVTAILSGNLLSGSYELVTFVFPLGLGLWAAADEAPFSVAYKRFTRVFFALATVSSVYGIVQYVVAPPWDVFWLKEVIKAGTVSFGQPYPFQIRVFSTLNDPGAFALFLAAVLLMALPELSLKKPALLVQLPIWFIAFGLTLVRTGWLMFAFGAIAYLILSPRRAGLLATLAIATGLIVAIATVLPTAVGNDGMLTSLTSRFSTLSDLDEDTSRKDRQQLYTTAPQIILANPFGTGLGVLGGSTRLSDAGSTTDFDSGYLGRSLEMGLPGLLLYLVPQFILLFAALKLWTQGKINNDQHLLAVSSVAVAMIASYVFLQFAHDANGFPTMIFWLIESLALSAIVPTQQARRVGAYA